MNPNPPPSKEMAKKLQSFRRRVNLKKSLWSISLCFEQEINVIVYILSLKRGSSLRSPNVRANIMLRFNQPDLSKILPVRSYRDGDNKLVRRFYWLDMDDRTFVMMMVKGIGACLSD
jgi:hypothetical protein